jgi:hypothetical protein
MSDHVQLLVNITRRMKAQSPLSEFAAAENLRFYATVEINGFSGAHLAAGPHQSFPSSSVRADGPQQKHLHFARAGGAMAKQPRWKHSRRIQNQAIARA